MIPHIQKLIDAVLLVDSTITPGEIKNISHLAIGIKTVIVNSKGEPYSISGKASKNTPLSEQLYTYYHSAASQHRFKTEDGKPDIKALRKIFTIRNNVVNKGKIFAKINGISRGFYNRKQVDGKPLLQSLKTVFPEIEELFIEIIKGKPRGTWTVRNGKNIKTGTPYVKYKNNYYDVISPTMNDLNKTDVLIDLIIHAVVNYNPGDSLESATILDQNGRSRKIFGKDGLVSTMILWGPSDTYKNKQIFIKANKFLVIGNKEYSIKEIIENQVVREKVKTEIGKLILPISHSRLSSNNAVYEPISVEDGIVHVKRYETYTEFLIENLKSDIVPINDEEQTHLSRYFTFDEPTEFIESPTQAKSQSEIKEPEEKPKWTHRSEYDSDINKDKKGYKQIKVRTKGSKKLEYKLEYGKDITIEGFEKYDFAIVKDKSGNYSIIEKSTGMNLGVSGITQKETIQKAKKDLSKIKINWIKYYQNYQN
ncbi:MAG: hypothetical protein KatS3mg002_1401 [Candidatus Woesearchaeota archaeon]|nr:MAG: hypothetical protein KatS3mg002_1401 [Candidatus Woesearchaeota archaeon]